MRWVAFTGPRAAILILVALSCQGSPSSSTLPEIASGETIQITFEPGNTIGTLASPLPINFNPSTAYTFHIEMHRADGSIDTDFNPAGTVNGVNTGYVRISSQPGTVYTVDDGQYGRNVLIQNGVADNVGVSIIAAFGATRVWATDVGYVPVTDLARVPPPQCANNIDDNGNGLIDFPADPGCFAPNDDTEDFGTGATGVSEVIYYQLPRIADVRGGPTNDGTATAFPNEQVNVNTGYDLTNNVFLWDTVVTGISSTGFFVTDLQDAQNDPQANLGYGSVFAYTFSAPTLIGVCDRLRLFEGTSADFFGYTEMNFPTWSVEYWDPGVRPCLVPEPLVLQIADWGNTALLFKNESGLVRIQAGINNITLHVGAHFGQGLPPACQPPATLMNGMCVNGTAMTAPYSNLCNASGVCTTDCDLAGEGKVDYDNANDAACANACTADIECTEYSGYGSTGGFTIVMTDGTNTAKTQGDATAATNFDPVASAGMQIGAFSGIVRYFSGGSQFTIQSRCQDDVIADPQGAPIDSSHACVNQNGNNPEQGL